MLHFYVPACQGMPGEKDFGPLALEPASGSAPEADGSAPPGKVGAVPLDSLGEAKENLRQFTESVHQKAAQVVHWVQQIEPLQTERSKQFLCSTGLQAVT